MVQRAALTNSATRNTTPPPQQTHTQQAASPRRAPAWELVIEDLEPEFAALAEVAGNLVNYRREAGFALDIIRKSEHLQKCSAESIRVAVRNVAAIGITLNPVLKLAYLVPREGMCCLDISAPGLVKIATDSGSVLAAKAVVVRANDTYEPRGPFDMPVHQYKAFASDAERGEIIGAYSVAKLHNGTVIVDELNMDTINKIRSVSKARNGPWQQWFEEMVKKTTVKRGYKSWPKTERLSMADDVLNQHEGLEEVYIDQGPGTQPLTRREQNRQLAQNAVTPTESPERKALIAELETLITEQGQDAYEVRWRGLTGLQRRMVGQSEHERLWALGDITTVNEGGAA